MTRWNCLSLMLTTALLLMGLSGCANWPRYLHMEDDDDFVLDQMVAFEDESLASDAMQDLGTVYSGTEILFYGFLLDCGYDDDASWPEWPLHDVEGTEVPLNAGWFTGDVDWISFTVSADTQVQGTLEWFHRPAGSVNATYKPNEPTATWSMESDLDVVVFLLEGADERLVFNESGISNAYPEVFSNPPAFKAGDRVGLAIGCHHNLATDYDLRLLIQ